MNAFYGRLGINKELKLTQLHNSESSELYQDLDHNTLALYSNLRLKNTVIKNKNASNIIIAAIITARARIKLYNSFYTIIKNNGRVLYTDTDSIIAAFKKEADVENKQLDQIMFDTSKHDTEIKDAVFIAPKTYILKFKNEEEVFKLKGVNENNYSFLDIKTKFYNNEPILFEKQSIKQKNLVFQFTKETVLVSTTNYNKRI